MSSLALDRRSKVVRSRSAKQSLMEAREALASNSRWAAGRFLRVVRQILESEEKSAPWMKLKLEAIESYMDRCGLPKRVEFDQVNDALTHEEKMQAYERAVSQLVTNPQRGRVQAVDVEFDLTPEQNGDAGHGPRSLPQ